MLLELLRSETRPEHQKLETVMTMPGNLAEYRSRLHGYLGFVEPWEQRLKETLREHPKIIEGRLKTPSLKSDLRYLGASEREIRDLPRCQRLPSMNSLPSALGSLYVMEGSTLGGQIIVRYVVDILGISPEGVKYFSSYGSEVGRRWQEMRQHLLSFSSPENDRVIVSAARETFRSLSQWFTPQLAYGSR